MLKHEHSVVLATLAVGQGDSMHVSYFNYSVKHAYEMHINTKYI